MIRGAVCAVVLAMSWVLVAQSTAGVLVISEFRVRGPSGANDEFVEIHNPGTTAHTVASSDGTPGYALAASSGGARFIIPNGTVIPPRGHFLGVNTTAYSIGNYPAGVGVTAIGDAIYTTDIGDNVGIALFSTSNPANFNTGTRIDAVGSTSEANTLYKEGTGYPALTAFSIDYAWYRNMSTGNAKDTDNNAADFVFVDPNGTSAGGGQRLGTPGPENSTSPGGDSGLAVNLLDPSVSDTTSPNFVRDFTSVPAQNSTFGSVLIRRTVTNTTSAPLTRLRFRISELNTFPAPFGVADLRPITSTATTATVNGATVDVLGTTLEQPPSQPNGGGFNTTMGVALATPLEPGASVSFQLKFGIQQTGQLRVCGNLEALPFAGGALGEAAHTDSGTAASACTRTQAFPPSGTVSPTVTGDAKQGETLTVSFGTWSGPEPITYAVQWRRCDGSCTDISGATDASYAPTIDDVGKTLVARVTATNAGGSILADSAATGAVLDELAPALTASTDGAVRQGEIDATVACPTSEASCSGTLRYVARKAKKKKAPVEYGSGTFALDGDTSTTVGVQLTKSAARKRSLKAKMVADVVDAAGNTNTVEEDVVLKKRK